MIQETLREALHKHQQGDLAGASTLYLRILQYDPNNVDALGLMSLIAENSGDHDTAIDLASKAIQLKPSRIEFYINLANPLMAADRVDEAITTLEKALKVNRRSIDALSTMGDAYQKKGQYETAIEFYHKGLRLDRSDPILYNNLGNAYSKSGLHEKAIEFFEKALSLNPNYLDAHCNLGLAYHQLGKTDEAFSSLERAKELDPNHYQVSHQLGAMYCEKNELNKALQQYQIALTNNPNPKENFSILAAMGDISLIQTKMDSAEDCYRVALKLKQDEPNILRKLAHVLYSQNKTDEAHEIYDQLLAENPDRLELHLLKALCVPILYPSTEAINTCRQSTEDYFQKVFCMDFDDSSMAKPAFYLSYHGKNNRPLMEALGDFVHKHTVCVETSSTVWNSKPKIGFISSFLSQSHTIGKLNQGFIKNISRDLFDIVVFSIGKTHEYNQTGDENPQDEYILLCERNLDEARKIILEHNLDILFYTDIGMDENTFTLAHSRLAKVQCVTWGHPDTTGLKTIDYFVSSKLIEPENAQEHYVEELFLMENLPTFYSAPPKIESEAVRSVLGLSETDTFYICPQSIFKLHPEFDTIIAEILRRDPNGRLVLLSATAQKANEDLQTRFQTYIPDVVDRIIFAPRMMRQDFLILLGAADVMLDPFHFGGGNTTFEALAYGTPIVTWPGEFMRGRVTHGCYQKMNYTQLVAKTPEEYINLATRLGTDPEFRAQAKADILERCGVLYEDYAALSELEEFFLNAIDKAKAKQGESHA